RRDDIHDSSTVRFPSLSSWVQLRSPRRGVTWIPARLFHPMSDYISDAFFLFAPATSRRATLFSLTARTHDSPNLGCNYVSDRPEHAARRSRLSSLDKVQ